MIFAISRTTLLGSSDAPALPDGFRLKRSEVPFGRERSSGAYLGTRTAWVIEINTLEELAALQVACGSRIIVNFGREPEIEIYDARRE